MAAFRLSLIVGFQVCAAVSVNTGIHMHGYNAEESHEQPMAGAKVARTRSQRVADWKHTINARVEKGNAAVNKGITELNAKFEHSVGNLMSKANSVMDDVHSAASNTLQGVKDFSDSAADPIVAKVNNGTAVLNTKVKTMIGKINKAIDDMKSGAHELATGVTRGMKEATEKISAQLAQSVHEHVRQEIELARSAEPAS
eukprot:CAMPEP_0171172890 /NCGR_PEP_ID=MMETSP0790-20130122/9946_1 /TAXON_ID=2925 /ORGANISM="Alexandrium catenella, Strain OF101" /LENGTH=198 /DNA_ID=CAMNT_0011637749 /DNA_START=85 /DNA_END=681 /DNA_ORIENTATION=+